MNSACDIVPNREANSKPLRFDDVAGDQSSYLGFSVKITGLGASVIAPVPIGPR